MPRVRKMKQPTAEDMKAEGLDEGLEKLDALKLEELDAPPEEVVEKVECPDCHFVQEPVVSFSMGSKFFNCQNLNCRKRKPAPMWKTVS